MNKASASIRSLVEAMPVPLAALALAAALAAPSEAQRIQDPFGGGQMLGVPAAVPAIGPEREVAAEPRQKAKKEDRLERALERSPELQGLLTERLVGFIFQEHESGSFIDPTLREPGREPALRQLRSSSEAAVKTFIIRWSPWAAHIARFLGLPAERLPAEHAELAPQLNGFRPESGKRPEALLASVLSLWTPGAAPDIRRSGEPLGRPIALGPLYPGADMSEWHLRFLQDAYLRVPEAASLESRKAKGTGR